MSLDKFILEMKRLFSLIVILIAFSGCSDEISMPAPGLQAYKDGALWRAEDFKAYLYPDGHIRIVGLMANEQLELNLSDFTEGYYYTASTDLINSAGFTTRFDDDVLHYLTYDANGPIGNINNPVLISGLGYTESFSVATSSSGDGTGMRVNTKVDDQGRITNVTISSPGINYEPGDIISISGGNNKAKFKVLSAIEITSLNEQGISGNFRFTARRAESHPFASQMVAFEFGGFHNIPITVVD